MKGTHKRFFKEVGLFAVVFAVVACIFISTNSMRKWSGNQDTTLVETPSIENEKIKIGVSTSFLADMIGRVGGEKVFVEIIPQVQCTPPWSRNVYEKPIEGQKIFDTLSMYFALDKPRDGWAVTCLLGNTKTALVWLDEYIQARGDATGTPKGSGYYWLSLSNGEEMVRFIARALSEADPINKVFYLNNAHDYVYELNELKSQTNTNIRNAMMRPIVTQENMWNDFVEEYGGEIKKTIKNTNDKKELEKDSAAAAAFMKQNARAWGIVDVSFPLDVLRTKSGGDISRVKVLDPLGIGIEKATYMQLIEENVRRCMM